VAACYLSAANSRTGAVEDVEAYGVELANVAMLTLTVVPDFRGSRCATLEEIELH